MKTLLLIVLVLTPGAALGQGEWGTSFDAAKSASVRSKKPILIDFMAVWCGPCRKMDEETFADPRVKALLQRMVLVRLDVDRSPPQAAYYGVNSIPRLIVLPSGGGKPLLDVQGFCDADMLIKELRPALGLKPEAAAGEPAQNSDASRVRQALEANQYAALKAQDAKSASLGLDGLVEQLGVTKEADYEPLAALIRKAGQDAVPALIRGLGHNFLAVRAGAYRGLQEALKSSGSLPAFDPWASTKNRKLQQLKWTQWWEARKTR